MKTITIIGLVLTTFIFNVYSIEYKDLDLNNPELAVNNVDANNNMDPYNSSAIKSTIKDSIRNTRVNFSDNREVLTLKFDTLKYNPPKENNLPENLKPLPLVNQGLTISEPLNLNMNMNLNLSINNVNSGLLNSNKNNYSFWEKITTNRNSNLDKWERMKIIGMYSAAIICNSIGDGMNNTHRKTMGHIFNAASIGFLVASPFVVKYEKEKWYWYLLTYTSLRLAFFDAGYNLTTNQPINYIGTTAITDKMYRAVGAGYNFSKSVGLLLGVTIPLRFI